MLGLFLVLSLLPAAFGTSFFERPFPDTVKEAPVIVRGKVGATYSDWARSSDVSKRIYTFWELQVEEVLKGAAGGATHTLLMRELGGEKDGIGMQISGAAHFSPGEQVVVLLGDRNAEGSYDIWGMMMGKYNIEKDEDGTEIIVGPGINSLTNPRIGDGHEGHGDTPGAKRWTLADLRRLISSQGAEPGEAVNPPPKRVVTPSPTHSPIPEASASATDSLAAPPLQISPSEDSTFPWWPGLALGAGVLGLIFILITKRRR